MAPETDKAMLQELFVVTCTLLATKPSSRTNLPPIRARTPPRRSITRTSRIPTPMHRSSIPPILHRARRRAKPALHRQRRENVILAATKRRPYPGQKVVQVRGDQARQLCGRGVWSVDDEREEEEREGQVL